MARSERDSTDPRALEALDALDDFDGGLERRYDKHRFFGRISFTETLEGGNSGGRPHRTLGSRASTGLNLVRGTITDWLRDDNLPFKVRLMFFIRHPNIEMFFGFCIVLNAIWIGVETDYLAQNCDKSTPQAFSNISLAFTAIFTLELGLKLFVDRWRFFCTKRENQFWNFLDVFIVMTSLLEIILQGVVLDLAGQGGLGKTTHFRVLRIIRMTRLIRIIRATKIIRFIRALRTLVHQILHTIKSLAWAMLLLTMVVFLFGIVFTQSVTTYRLEQGRTEHDFIFDNEPLAMYWSTLPRSMSTLYMAVTGGISWVEVVRPLSDINSFSVTLFIGYVSFVQFAVLNVLTGVFCQNAIESAQHDQDLVTQSILAQKKMYINRLRQIFGAIDADNSGTITLEEFKHHLENERVRAYFDSLELDTSDIWTLFKLMDTNQGDDIDAEEFIDSCLRLKGGARGVDMAKLIHDQTRLAKRLDEFMTYATQSFEYLNGSN